MLPTVQLYTPQVCQRTVTRTVTPPGNALLSTLLALTSLDQKVSEKQQAICASSPIRSKSIFGPPLPVLQVRN